MKYSIKTEIISGKNSKKVSPLRMRVSFAGARVDIRLGLSILPECWDSKKERAHSKKTEHQQICKEVNMRINDFIKQLDELFARCELVEKRIPTIEEVKNVAQLRLNTSKFDDVVDQYLNENKHLEMHTIYCYQNLKNHIKQLLGNIYINDINTDLINRIVNRLSRDFKNSSIDLLIRNLKTILSFATKKGLYNGNGASYEFKLKRIPRVIVYLTRDELMKFLAYEPENIIEKRIHLVYCFCAFTGLRVSDAVALKWENVENDSMKIVTTKTTDNIIIEFNRYSRMLLEWAKEEHQENNNVFHNVAKFYYNNALKDICRKLGFDTPITYIYYKGNKRIEDVMPKWRFMSIHTARKTFVINAITLNIPLEVIMKWTGHKTLEAIKPYLKIVDEVKRENMNKFDDL